MGDMSLTMYRYDKTEWEELRSPAYTDVTGYYPQDEKKIMMPLWVLESLVAQFINSFRYGHPKYVLRFKNPLKPSQTE